MVFAFLAACSTLNLSSTMPVGITEIAPGIDLLEEVELSDGERLHVIASTSVLGDVVRHIGEDSIQLDTLIPNDADPHTYELTPADLQVLESADVVLVIGSGLEESLLPALDSLASSGSIILVPMTSEPHQEPAPGDMLSSGETHSSIENDPHFWMDPTYVMEWTESIATVLSSLDPANASEYRRNQQSYLSDLNELHTWIEGEVAAIPERNRILISDHISLTHFGDRYGFHTGWSIIPSASTSAEPSAKDMAALQDFIREAEVPAVFYNIANPSQLLDRIGEDLDILVVPLYIGALSDRMGPASSYVEMMRYNTALIVNALQ